MAGTITCLSILTLNVNGLDSLIKKHRIVSWIKKQNLTVCCLQETYLIDKTNIGLTSKGGKSFPSKWNQKTESSYIHIQ
jgi:exonuclease III